MAKSMKVKIKQMMYDRRGVNRTISNMKKSLDEVTKILNSKNK